MLTYHEPVGDFSSDHAEGHDVQGRMMLVYIRFTLLEYDEGRHHHQRERYHRWQDASPLGTVKRCTLVLRERRMGKTDYEAVLKSEVQPCFN